MNQIQSQINSVTSNAIGAIVGGVAMYYGAKKLNVSNKWAVWGIALAGVIVGANVQKGMSAAKSKPTASTTK